MTCKHVTAALARGNEKEATLDFTSGSPIYLQVIMEIRNRIITGNLKPGDKLPSSRELAIQFSINPNTAARVYSEMENMGLSYTKRGIGTFVTEEEEKILALKEEYTSELMEEFIRKMKKIGYGEEACMECLRKFLDEKKAMQENGCI